MPHVSYRTSPRFSLRRLLCIFRAQDHRILSRAVCSLGSKGPSHRLPLQETAKAEPSLSHSRALPFIHPPVCGLGLPSG